MASTYNPIASTTLSVDTANITFSNISASYKHLIVKGSVSDGTSFDLYLRVNEDNTSGYVYQQILQSKTSNSQSSTASINTGNFYFNSQAYNGTSSFTPFELFIADYTNTSSGKTLNASFGVGDPFTDLLNMTQVSYWPGTAAITTLRFYASGLFLAGTSIQLYGISNS